MSFTNVPYPVSCADSGVSTLPRRRTAASKTPARATRRFAVQPLAAALALGFASSGLLALPQGAQVVQGNVQIHQQGSHLQVRNTAGAIIQWQSFGIGSGQSVYFQQQGAHSSVLNRVTGGRPSEILGTLGSNGRVFLINSAGIVFGRGAVLDTAGFTASTLNVSDTDWRAGKVRLQADGVPGGIAITGAVQAHGDVYLIAPQITNQGVLKVEQGHAILAAGQSVTITGRGLEGVQLEVANRGDTVLNLGSVEAGAVGLFAGTLKQRGMVHADGLETVDGKVWLKGRHQTEVAGAVSARNGERGGQIVVTGEQTHVLDGATLDASGRQGGGAVLVGGGWQGRDATIENAGSTSVAPGATLKADAVEVGDGGTVVVWSDGRTVSRGKLSARGGARGGNGGRVETSGKTLLRSGVPDVSAPMGQGGRWLLDPESIVIRAGSGSTNFDGNLPEEELPGQATEVFESELEAFFSFGSTVTIEATRAITAEGWGAESELLMAPGVSLWLETKQAGCATGAACGINLRDGGPTRIATRNFISGSTFVGDITLLAGTDSAQNAGPVKASVALNDVSTDGGRLRVQAVGDLTARVVNTAPTFASEFTGGGSQPANTVSLRSSAGSIEIDSLRTRDVEGGRRAAVEVVTQAPDGDVTLHDVEADLWGSVGRDLHARTSNELGLGAVTEGASASTVVRGLSVGRLLDAGSDSSGGVQLRAAVTAGTEARFTGLGSFRIDTGETGGDGTLAAPKVSFQGNGFQTVALQAGELGGGFDDGLTIDQGELDRITAGRLLVSTIAGVGEGTPPSIEIRGGEGGGNVNLSRFERVDFFTDGEVIQSGSSLQTAHLDITAARVDLSDTGNQLGSLAFRVQGNGFFDGTVSVFSDGLRVLDGSAERSILPVSALAVVVPNPTLQLDAGEGSLVLDGTLTSDSLRLSGASIVNGPSGKGRIEATAGGDGAVQLFASGGLIGGSDAGDAIRVQLAADDDNQLYAQTLSGGQVALHLEGDAPARTGQVEVLTGSGSTFSRGVLLADASLLVDKSMGNFDDLELRSQGGDVQLGTGVLSAGSRLTVRADQGSVLGDASAKVAQLRSDTVVLAAANQIRAATEAGRLDARVGVGSGTAAIELNNLGTATLQVLQATNDRGDVTLRTLGDLDVRPARDEVGPQVQGVNVNLEAGGALRIIGAPALSAKAAQRAGPNAAPLASGDAGVLANESLQLKAGTEVLIQGVDGAASAEGGTVTIDAASLTVGGGSAAGAYGAIRYGDTLTVNMPASGGSVRFVRGSGENADAVAYATGAKNVPVLNNVVCDDSCTGDYGTDDPFGIASTNAGFIQIAPPPPPPPGAPETGVDIPVIQVLVELQRTLETERFGKVAVEAENVCR
ncbi:hypothetical protein AAW51_1209 [Caldimonas brevitalea]|uniref:Filamentous haemagglutinin FhaB/tRNA nuclease CdiA-like TPS domain-containing protein n=2 Tax=Caldimonas brevitalea TaxID=413882 RepID=A0A0G3BMY4_9BURK|nr:hypothetical protein AAW51_1209 [Caldimonas brevitalea]